MTATQSPDAAPATTHPNREMPYLELVDPRELIQADNSKDEIPIEERNPWLTQHVAEFGVKTPITANPTPDGRLRVRFGFGRTQAAVLAVEQHPKMMVIVVDNSDDRPESVLLDQMAENDARTGYTEAERANNYSRLVFDYGMDIEKAATATGQSTEAITAGLAVAQSPRTKEASQQAPQLGLLELEPLAEFENDPEAHATLVETLVKWPSRFDYTIAQLRDRRIRDQRIAETMGRMRAQGYAITDDDEDLPDGAQLLENLYTGDEEPTVLLPEAHRDCPGRAVYVTTDYKGDIEVTEMCLAFAEHGHREIAAVNIARAEEELRAHGVVILQGELPETARDLAYVSANSAARTPLSPEEHAGCPGHAAYVDTGRWGGHNPVAHYVCTNVAEHGHHDNQLVTAATDEPSAEFRKGERDRTRHNNAEWQNQKDRRRKWLASTLFADWRRKDAKSLPKRLEHWLALAAIEASDDLDDAAPRYEYAITLLKLKAPKTGAGNDNPFSVLLRRKGTTQQQVVMIRLAQVLGALESYFDKKFTNGNADATWRRPKRDTKFYFEFLEVLGYTLSPVEQLVNNPKADEAHWPHLSALSSDATSGDVVTDSTDISVDDDATVGLAPGDIRKAAWTVQRRTNSGLPTRPRCAAGTTPFGRTPPSPR